MRPSAGALWLAGVAVLQQWTLCDSSLGLGLGQSVWSEGSHAFVRQLQDGVANATNATAPVLSECQQAIRDLGAIEQCEAAYRANDCPEATNKNRVPWSTLEGPFILLHIFGVLVMFMSLSVVCDEFFVPGARRKQRERLCWVAPLTES